MPAASASPSRKKSPRKKSSSSREAPKKNASRSRSRDDRKRRGRSRSRSRDRRSRDRSRDRRRRRDSSSDDRRRRDRDRRPDRRRQRVTSSSSEVRRRRRPSSSERRRRSSSRRDRRDRKRGKDSSSEDEKEKKEKKKKESKFDSREVIDVVKGNKSDAETKEETGRFLWEDDEEKDSKAPTNPFPKGSPEALRLDAARLEVARYKALGKVPPAHLTQQVAAGAQAAAISGPATGSTGASQARQAQKKAAPPPWLASRAVFAGKDSNAGSASPSSSQADASKEGAKAKKKLDLAELSELSKNIAEERNKLRLFVVKAKEEFEEKGKAVVMGETDQNEYYSASVGEEMGNDRDFRVEASIGKGVFSSVYHCKGLKDNRDYAVKLIRANSMMRKCAEKEVEMYKRLEKAAAEDAEGSKHLILLTSIQTFEHCGHLCFVFDLLKCDMRAALQKYGMGAGLALPTLQQYIKQLFLGLRALRTLKVVHADLKPDNILMTLNKAEVKICDFGSAMDASESIKTSYLQPRYYRAPEIMLGLPFDMGIDMWSAGTTLYELATGKMLFNGKTNNQMMGKMISVTGKFPERMYTAGEFSKKHFKANGDFISRDPDSITGLPDVIQLSKPTRTVLNLLQAELKHPNAGVEKVDHEKWVVQLADLVSKLIRPDPEERIKPAEALELLFFNKDRG